jgi:hypothetical protein
MRLSISLDNEVYRLAKAYSVSEGISISKAINTLLSKFSQPMGEISPSMQSIRAHPLTGLPVSRCDSSITREMVEQAEADEDKKSFLSGMKR